MLKFTDKYFERSNQILKAEDLNPWINMQVFVRKGPGKVAGVDEAVELILNNSNLAEVGGRIYAKEENGLYGPKETVMNIVTPIQEIMELETLYLGVLTAGTTRLNDKKDLDFNKIGEQMREVNDLTGDRSVLYLGARHWHWTYDQALANLAFENGCTGVATDNGAETRGQKGFGTIPHALENVFAKEYGMNNAVKEAVLAFDRVIDPSVPRIALPDYANLEITNTLESARALEGRLYGVRFDTCGENVAEGGVAGDRKYWEGKGVTVNGVANARRKINEAGLEDLKFGLSSGFSNPEKVKAFNEGEKQFGMKLYDLIGAGFLDGVRTFTADVVAIADDPDKVDFYTGNGVEARDIYHKVGRGPKLGNDLRRVV